MRHFPEIVGRDAERTHIDFFTASVQRRVSALVIKGEPGIGKTLLWQHTVEQCRNKGYRILSARPAEEEMPFVCNGLVDLFEDLELDAVAFDPESTAIARGRAVLEVLRRLARESTTILAIDDAQWLDSVSASALRYALRRVDAEPLGIVMTLRVAEDTSDPLAVAGPLPTEHYQTLELGPLSVGALRRLLTPIVATISRPALRRIHEVSGGNPLFAIELARGLQDEGHYRSPRAMPLPESLHAAIAGHLRSVPEELRPVLNTVSAVGRSSVRELEGIHPTLDVGRLLSTAIEARVLVVDDNLDVRFANPLIGSAVYTTMSPLQRSALHARLARRASDPDVHAHHVALATDEPDPDAAQLLEDAARRAGCSGALDLAAEFSAHSLRLTPGNDSDAKLRRSLLETERLAAAGEVGGALALADELVATLPAGPGRAEALIRRAELEDDDLNKGESLLVQALDDAGDDALLRARVLDMLGWLRGVFRGDLRGGIECAREALIVGGGVGGPSFKMSVAAGLSNMEALTGNPRLDLINEAVAIEEEIGRPPLWAGPRVLLAEQLLWAGDLTAARALFESAHEQALRSGNGRWISYGLYDLASLECAAGNFDAANACVRDAMQAALDSGDAHVEVWILHRLALVASWLGRSTEARAAARHRLEIASRRGDRPGVARSRWTLGFLALSEGNAESAVVELVGAVDQLEEMGWANPGSIPALPDAIEALAITGDARRSEELFERLRRQESALDNAWVRAVVDRTRGVVLLATGDAAAAVPSLEDAIASFERSGHRPDAARALLALGRALLRAGRRSRAAETFAEARSRFGQMGATLWTARAAEELERAAPGRAAGKLTPAERRVAALVARGMRNREISRSLFMSVATVEAHLTRTYRKLEIRSRSELARLVTDGTVEISEEVHA
jgi:DNA-binding NarL/FixJ family response regulator